MGKLYDTYMTARRDGDDFLKEVSFEEYVYFYMKRFKCKMFNVSNDEESINKALEESERIWNSEKKGKISFIPSSLRYESKEVDFKDSNWGKCSVKAEDKKIKVIYSMNGINLQEIVGNYNKLKIKEGYTLQIYKVVYEGNEEGRILAFRDKNDIQNISNENINYDSYDGIEIKVKGTEDNYINAVEFERSPEGYLQMVLLKNYLDNLCGIEDTYEIVDRRIKIDNESYIIDEPCFYYNEDGNPTIEYFEKYSKYNEAYKRVINVFDSNESTFKIVDQIVHVIMR